MIDDTRDVKTAIYRLWNAEDALIYIGIAKNPAARFAKHAERSHWWPEVASIQIDWAPTRDEALSIEREAIRAEKPRYNVRHNGVPPHLATAAPTYTCAECGARITDGEAGYLQVDRVHAANFRRAQPPAPEGWTVIAVSTLWDPGRIHRAKWQAVHVECDTIGDDAYWWDLDRVRTWPAFMHFVAHVTEKSWVTDDTNLPSFLRGVVS